MSTCEGVSFELQARLLAHLSRCVMVTPPPQQTLNEAPLKKQLIFPALDADKLLKLQPAGPGGAPAAQEPSGTEVWRPW